MSKPSGLVHRDFHRQVVQARDAEIARLTTKLAEAKRIGLEAVRLAESADLDAMASPHGAGGCGAATTRTNDIAAARAALEAL